MFTYREVPAASDDTENVTAPEADEAPTAVPPVADEAPTVVVLTPVSISIAIVASSSSVAVLNVIAFDVDATTPASEPAPANVATHEPAAAL